MKRNITDLLDTYGDPALELNLDTPLSPERIKVRTLKKITENNHRHKRIVFRVLAAAAIIVAMGLTVFAAGSATDWFLNFFAGHNDGALSDGQVEFIDSNALLLNQSKTVNGYTVTLESYISDGSSAYLKILVQAPEGTEIAKQGITFADTSALLENDEAACGFLTWDLEERNENNTVATYMLTLDFVVLEEVPGETNVIILELEDLYNGPEPIGGSWRFEIEVPDESIELLTESIGGVQARNEEGQTFEVTVTSARLRPMGLRLVYEVPAVEGLGHHQFGTARAVMQDGTTVELLPVGFGRSDDGDDTFLWVEYYGGILSLKDIEYIELPGIVKLSVNEE